MTPPIYTKLVKIDGANGRNWPGIVHLDPEAPYRAAVWAQEAYEATYKLNPVNALKIRFSSKARRKMEILSHEIEVQATVLVYAKNAKAIRWREAASMQRGYNGLFAEMTQVRIEQLMLAHQATANRWVRQNLKQIKKWME